MDVGKPGWLAALTRSAVTGPAPVLPSAAPAGGLRGKAAARLHLRRFLRENGVLYGTPSLPAGTASPLLPTPQSVPAEPSAHAPHTAPVPKGEEEDALFIALMRVFCRMARELATLVRDRPPSQEELLVLFAAFTAQWDDVEEVQEILETGLPSPLRRSWSKVEEALGHRAMSLSGNPVYGLVLHNGALYADAELFGRHAIAYFARGALHRPSARRRNEVSARQKALLVQVLTALSCAERPPTYTARRAILRQIEDLRLPPLLESKLRSEVKRSFDGHGSLEALTSRVRSDEMKRFILEQTLLASLVDGHRSPKELAFMSELATAFGYTNEQRQTLESEMAQFYRTNRQVVDVFTVSAAASVLDDELIGTVQTSLEKNFSRLMQEVKETRELSILLGRAARGHKLTSEERKRMREQLIDVAKAVPALAIFAAPGGIFLLVALAKILPFSLLPSAFQEPETEPLEDELAES